ncbi:MAG TPA: cofactor-independent phosphoglycerate mutase [Clostridiales bacterium]|nr:cofactor-independent phosphoglycerate mutase [Clostridiales bacterium]
MKYLILLCDGMADYPVPELGGKTPMEAANKPNMDRLAKSAEIGLVKTVGEGLKPGSDVANLTIMGYDPGTCYTGRSPLEAASIGIDLDENDLALRCNLVTLSEDNEYSQKTMVDYCAGDIHTAEAAVLIDHINQNLGSEKYRFYPGVSYRHCLVIKGGLDNLRDLTPPHDISGQKIADYINSEGPERILYQMMEKSFSLLSDHPVNIERKSKGLNPANSIWLWGAGKKPRLDNFFDKYNVKAGVVSAVDLIKGIGVCAGMEVANVEGATGYIDTNFNGKAQAAINMLKNGCDLVYLHLEAPDECGHRGEIQNKVKSIELIDQKVLAPVLEALETFDDYKIMIMPDHPTPLSTKTHSGEPVPYLIYQKSREYQGSGCFSEKTAKAAGRYIEKGYELMGMFLSR